MHLKIKNNIMLVQKNKEVNQMENNMNINWLITIYCNP